MLCSVLKCLWSGLLGPHKGRGWFPAWLQSQPHLLWDQLHPTLPLASKGSWFSSEGLLHLCVFSLRIPSHPASCGSPSHSPSPEAAERAANLLRDSWQHLLHRQDQLSGSGPRPTPLPTQSSVPLLCYFSQRQTNKDQSVHFSVREAFISDGGAQVNGGLPVCAQQASQHSSLAMLKNCTAINTPRNIVIYSTKKPNPVHALFLSKGITSVFLGVF